MILGEICRSTSTHDFAFVPSFPFLDASATSRVDAVQSDPSGGCTAIITRPCRRTISFISDILYVSSRAVLSLPCMIISLDKSAMNAAIYCPINNRQDENQCLLIFVHKFRTRTIARAISKLLDKVNEIISMNGRVIAGAVSANLGLGRQCVRTNDYFQSIFFASVEHNCQNRSKHR
ncbi:hypothetical protein TcasGA2_TC009056 [Tribolium castaneum]|uniref:Uncharacterized protein n=1 Tax=Tribolium castaneum TaxID=7070 RepID=D6WPK6_TRICA|nr:hypothetical protein TcasGA2_TC009056 [Tribolium castaneum]